MKRFAQIGIILIVSFMGAMILTKVKYSYAWEDTFWRTLLAPITKAVWAKDFSEAKFKKIKNGMAQSELLNLVGEPLYRNCDNDGCVWYYSGWHKDAIEFDRRWVSLNTAGRVDYVWRDFYID